MEFYTKKTVRFQKKKKSIDIAKSLKHSIHCLSALYMVKCTHTFRTVQICKCSRYPYQNWTPSRHIRLTGCCNPYTYFFFQV